jgi:hypothetical protein
MKTVKEWVVSGVAITVLAGMAMMGCETTKSEDNVITVTPANTTLTNDYATVVLTASSASTNGALALPLRWSVSNPERGTVSASGAMMAVYRGNRLNGENMITVRDQGDNEGVAVVFKE